MIWEEDLKINIHDCYYDINNEELNDELIDDLFNNLPSNIKRLAEQWGGFDTEVSDKVYEWILYLKNKETYKNYSNPGVYKINWSKNLKDKEIQELLELLDEED